MSKKPTYEELEQRVKELEKEAIDRKRVEEALRESEVRYRHLVALSPDGIAIESEGNIAFINKAGVEILGAKNASQLIGKPVMDFVHSDYHKIVKERIRQLKEEGKVPLNEEKYIRLDGIAIDVEVTVSPIIYQNKLATQIFVRDITERKRAEEALRESEAEKKAILDASIDRIRLVDTDMRILWSNKTTARELNISPEDLVGQYCYKAFVGTDSPCTECPAKKALKSGNIEHAVMHQPKSKGIKGETYWDSYAVPVKNEEGDIVNIIQVTRNITETKRAEETLRKYERIMSAAQEHMSLLDRNYIYQAVNDAYLKAHSKKQDEIIGHSVSELLGQQVFNKLVKDKLDQCLAGEDIHYQWWFDFPGLGRRYMDVAYYPFFEEDRSVSGVVVASRDITETKRFEDQFQHAQRMESIGTLAGGIAHNFNNVLMGIQGYASLMLMDIQPTHPHRNKLEGIEKQVQSGAELTKQLLGFARGGKYEIIATNLNELIKTQNRMFGRTKKEITIRGKYEENLWIVEVDQGQIEQVLLNLYVNAWQAMPGGGDLYIQTENVTLDEDYTKPFSVDPGRYVKISITDTGVGMDEETQRRIFEPFFTTQEMGIGTGLGLASVYGIIKNHDGIINVYSVKGEGSTFTIYLPASEKEIIKEEKIPEKILKGTETVLLVDDEDIILGVEEGILKTLGYKVLIARSGKEAIEVVSKAQRAKRKEDKRKKGHAPGAMPLAPDIVILDMIMPVMGGGETYDRMKEINPNIKVLLSTGYSIDGQATEILKRGCDGFIQKPFNMKGLSQRIREILDS